MEPFPESSKTKFFKVCECKREFTVSATYYRHKKRCSASEIFALGSKSYNYVCKEEDCSFTAKISEDFTHHLQDEHNIECSNEFKEFCNYSEFEIWKADYEKKTNSSYNQRSDKKSAASWNIKYFYCNRSGCYESKSNRKRVLKSQGLGKIGSNCPSHIKVYYQNHQEKVTVCIQHTHYGHFNELAHIRIPKDDRITLASQLAQGVEFSQIMQDLLSEASETIQRKHLCTKRDLKNITRSYGIEKVEKHPDESFGTISDIDAYLNDFSPIMCNTDLIDSVAGSTNVLRSLMVENSEVENMREMSPVMSSPDEPMDNDIDATDVLKSLIIENSEVESLKNNLLQKTLSLFVKIQNISDKNALLTVTQHLNNAYSVAELNAIPEGEISTMQMGLSTSDNTDDLLKQAELDLSETERTIEDTCFTIPIFNEESALNEKTLIKCNVPNILDPEETCWSISDYPLPP